MLKIYGGPTFNAVKVVLTAEQAGLEYEYIAMNLPEGEHKTPEHLTRQALGKIPAIEHNGKPLFESAAICRYLAQVSNSSLYDGDIYEKAIIDQWIDMMTCHAGRWLGALYFNEFIKPLYFKQEADQAIVSEATEFLSQQLPVIDKQLAKSKYLASDNLTIADLFAFSYFQTHEKTSVDLSAYANITAWYDNIKQLPSVAKTNDLLGT